ncbi:MAG: lysophospholipid acyltransferase family protein [Gammaproteobacteria bacterium]|nr:lysophospholipid acyltransferase family protein [Gammaproteobacteria bacterium]
MRFLIPLFRFLSILPLRWQHRLGWLIGRLYILIPNRERDVTEINLQLCFPASSSAERMSLRNRSLEQAGRTLMEMAAIWFWPIERVLSLIVSVSGEEHLQRKPQQGLIVLAPHLGCWEIAGLYLAKQGGVVSLYRPPRQSALETIVKAARERSGAQLVPTNARGVKRLYRVLQTGGITGILPDQQPDSNKGSVFAPFFGVPALTMLLINRLVQKTGSKVVFCYALRLPGGQGFAVHYLPAPDGIDAADPRVAGGALNQGVETCIAACPEQYQWSYKRFKDQPEGVRSPYRRRR